MKIAALTSIVVGLLAALMAGLTALDVVPGFVDFGLGFGDTIMTTAFWGGLSALILVAAIAFGVITGKE
jgi:hypothetical protein